MFTTDMLHCIIENCATKEDIDTFISQLQTLRDNWEETSDLTTEPEQE